MDNNTLEIQSIVSKQRAFFNNGSTLSIKQRKGFLHKLKSAICNYNDEISESLKRDLNKSEFEGYISEISIVLNEITYMEKHIRRLAKPRRVSTSIINFPSSGRIIQEPYGVVLIMSPWNYPFQLTLTPLAGAIAAGNCAVLKPSNYSSATSAIITKIIESVFPPEYVSVVQGGRDVNQSLLENRFDFIFFTGGVAVGKLVMEKASRYLTPVVLELGGKSPCVVDETADIQITAKRLVWGKGLNAGQTCVAPDYLLVQDSVHDKLLSAIKKEAALMFTDTSSTNENFPKIITKKHFERLCALLEAEKENIVWGGKVNSETGQIDLTFVDNVDFSSEIMKDEIFGPILPIIKFHTLESAAEKINSREKPLALYLFSTSKKNQDFIVNNVPFGGGCINDTIVHLANDELPFGGVGNSGMGSYHGSQSFYTFSHSKSILKKSVIIDIKVRYPPYKKGLVTLIKKLM